MATNLDYWVNFNGSANFTSPLIPNKFLKFIKKEAKILDLGCGYGRVLNYLYNKGYKNLTGVDPSSCLIEQADLFFKERGISDVCLKVGTLADVAEEKFDVIVICAVIEYIISPSERVKFVSLLSNMLNENGLVYLETFIIDDKNKTLYREAFDKGYALGSLILSDRGLILFHDSRKGIDSLFKKKFIKLLSANSLFVTWKGRRTKGYECLFMKKDLFIKVDAPKKVEKKK